MNAVFDSDPAAPYHARAMAHALYDRRTPKELAEARQVVDYKGVVSDFPRLLEVVRRDLEHVPETERPPDWRTRPVAVTLSFGFADTGRAVPAVEGWVTAELDAVCQRCLEPFPLPLAADFRHVLAAGGEEYSSYGVWELADDTVRPVELVEEALIMALPMSAAHESIAECGALADRIDQEQGLAQDTARPFAALRELIEDKE